MKKTGEEKMETVEKISATKIKNLLKKLNSKMDWEGEFVKSITITTTTWVFDADDEIIETKEVNVFSEDDVCDAYCFVVGISKLKIEARFGNGEGFEKEFIRKAYQELLEMGE
jgi:hypothetical protein